MDTTYSYSDAICGGPYLFLPRLNMSALPADPNHVGAAYQRVCKRAEFVRNMVEDRRHTPNDWNLPEECISHSRRGIP